LRQEKLRAGFGRGGCELGHHGSCAVFLVFLVAVVGCVVSGQREWEQ
jgi:hypothetical protein